jgi:putative chitinase
LINNPTIAATKEVGFRIAGQFWKLNGLNELADKPDFKLITKRINGGYNGLDDRLKYYERAKRVMNRDENAAATMASAASAAAAAAGGIAACPTPYLKQGCNGDDVRSMQERLLALGYKVSVDGSFGPGTCGAVKACQTKNGLTGDGVVGPKTWAAMWS